MYCDVNRGVHEILSRNLFATFESEDGRDTIAQRRESRQANDPGQDLGSPPDTLTISHSTLYSLFAPSMVRGNATGRDADPLANWWLLRFAD